MKSIYVERENRFDIFGEAGYAFSVDANAIDDPANFDPDTYPWEDCDDLFVAPEITLSADTDDVALARSFMECDISDAARAACEFIIENPGCETGMDLVLWAAGMTLWQNANAATASELCDWFAEADLAK